MNRIHRIVPDELAALAGNVFATLEAPSGGEYPVSSSQRDNLGRSTGVFEGARTSLVEARAAYHAAVQAHDAAREACANAVATVANVCYASPEVTPDMIAGLGLSPRSTSAARIVPHTPQALVAQPSASGEVLLIWRRGASPEGVGFIVEGRLDSGWTFLETTSRTRLRLSGYVPGVEASFQVTATKNGRRSASSNVATIYAGSAALRVAA